MYHYKMVLLLQSIQYELVSCKNDYWRSNKEMAMFLLEMSNPGFWHDRHEVSSSCTGALSIMWPPTVDTLPAALANAVAAETTIGCDGEVDDAAVTFGMTRLPAVDMFSGALLFTKNVLSLRCGYKRLCWNWNVHASVGALGSVLRTQEVLRTHVDATH